jgi:flagellar basal body P-ring formation protein FlgA
VTRERLVGGGPMTGGRWRGFGPALAVSILLLCAAAAAAAVPVERVERRELPAPTSPTVIGLRGDSTVRGPEIRLGDIADVHGADAALVERLKAAEVGRAPLPGLQRTLDLSYVKARLRLLQVDLAAVVLDAPPTIGVTTASQSIEGAEIVAAIREHILATRQDAAADLALQVPPPASLVLPAGRLELKVRTRSAAELSGSFSATVEAWVDGRLVRSLSLPVRVGVLAEILVAARSIPRGAILGFEDVRLERREVTAGLDPLREPAGALGRRATRTIAFGETVHPGLLDLPPLVRRGEIVLLTAEGRGLRAVAQGEAREDGRAGQVIRVRNLTSGREVYGQVEAERAVRVPF